MAYRKSVRIVIQVLRSALLGILLLPFPVSAQMPDPQKGNHKESTAKPAEASAGVTVDSARKSSELPAWDTTGENPGVEQAGYEIKQSVEFGGRISDNSGSEPMWDTLVNLGTGPRLLEFTLDMHAPHHTGLLFDDFSVSNFGYGGDP